MAEKVTVNRYKVLVEAQVETDKDAWGLVREKLEDEILVSPFDECVVNVRRGSRGRVLDIEGVMVGESRGIVVKWVAEWEMAVEDKLPVNMVMVGVVQERRTGQ